MLFNYSSNNQNNLQIISKLEQKFVYILKLNNACIMTFLSEMVTIKHCTYGTVGTRSCKAAAIELRI
jgi:hypothetical protein